MIRIGDDHSASVPKGRKVQGGGETVRDVILCAMFRPLVGPRARRIVITRGPRPTPLFSTARTLSGPPGN